MKGRTQPRILPASLGASGLMGGGRFTYDLHEMLWVWWLRLGGWEEDVGSHVGVCYEPSHLPVLSIERTHVYLSLLPPSFCPHWSPCQDLLTHLALRVGQKTIPIAMMSEGSLTLGCIYKCAYVPNTPVQIQVSMHTHSLFLKKRKKHTYFRAIWQLLKI